MATAMLAMPSMFYEQTRRAPKLLTRWQPNLSSWESWCLYVYTLLIFYECNVP